MRVWGWFCLFFSFVLFVQSIGDFFWFLVVVVSGFFGCLVGDLGGLGFFFWCNVFRA